MIGLLLGIIYISFISLGLPDALLGAAWPTMYQGMGVPVSYAGGIALIISAGTVVSSLLSDRLTKWLGPGKVTAISVGMTAAALLGFSVSSEFWQLCLWAIPYGLGAGSVDASLNNYVALHYASRHMSWLHCMWGLGASVGPYIMGKALTGGMSWNSGYRYIAIFQMVLTAVLFFSLSLWKNRQDSSDESGKPVKALTMKRIFAIDGAKEILLAFFCYCAAEQTAILWSATYLVRHAGLSEEVAAGFASMFLVGMTIGRFLSGFVTYKLNDTNMIRLGQGIMVLGILVMLLPIGSPAATIGLMLVGLGCAPIYPCIIHSTPAHFGADKSQAIIGVQMASAYVGSTFMPPVFGFLANYVSLKLMPVFMGMFFWLVYVMISKTEKICTGE